MPVASQDRFAIDESRQGEQPSGPEQVRDDARRLDPRLVQQAFNLILCPHRRARELFPTPPQAPHQPLFVVGNEAQRPFGSATYRSTSRSASFPAYWHSALAAKFDWATSREIRAKRDWSRIFVELTANHVRKPR